MWHSSWYPWLQYHPWAKENTSGNRSEQLKQNQFYTYLQEISENARSNKMPAAALRITTEHTAVRARCCLVLRVRWATKRDQDDTTISQADCSTILMKLYMPVLKILKIKFFRIAISLRNVLQKSGCLRKGHPPRGQETATRNPRWLFTSPEHFLEHLAFMFMQIEVHVTTHSLEGPCDHSARALSRRETTSQCQSSARIVRGIPSRRHLPWQGVSWFLTQVEAPRVRAMEISGNSGRPCVGRMGTSSFFECSTANNEHRRRVLFFLEWPLAS